MDSFRENQKSRKTAVFMLFLAIFGLFLAMFLTFQSYDFDARGPCGCRMTVQNFMEIICTVFEKFEIFMKKSGEKKTKKTTRLDK